MRERLANTREEAMRCLEALRESRFVTYDTETSGLDWKRNHVVGYVITPRGCPSWYVPLRHAGGGNLEGCQIPGTPDGWRGDLHWFEVELAKIARDVDRHWVGHYLLFDMRMSKRHGVELRGSLEDTMINSPLIDENARGHSLDAVAKREGVQAKKGEDLYGYLASLFGGKPERSQMEHFWRTDAAQPVVWEYAAGDGVTTEEVVDSQKIQIEEVDEFGRSLVRVHGVECRLIRTLYRMTTGGVRVNENTLDRVDNLFDRKARELSTSFPQGFNPKSPKSLKEFLGDVIGEDWPRNDPTKAELQKARNEGRMPMGALKFDEATLKLVPKGQGIITFKQMMNARSLYTQPMINRHLLRGSVYCDYAQMASDDYGTISGRLSCYDPNLQAVSKRNKTVGPAYRSAFEPDEGCTWEDRDYKQQEYVVFTDYTGDPNLMAGYAADPAVDIHSVVAEMLDVERDPTAKRMNLGMLYGMGIIKLAFSLGVSVQQATIWMKLYHKKFPYAKKFLKGAEQRARQRGFVFTYLGRRRRFPGGQHAHKAGNAIIQGSSADITKLKMVEIDEYFASEGDHCRLMLQIHDSLSWSAPKDDKGRRMTAEADRIMTAFGKDDQISLRAKLGIDSSSGSNWAEATWDLETCQKVWA